MVIAAESDAGWAATLVEESLHFSGVMRYNYATSNMPFAEGE